MTKSLKSIIGIGIGLIYLSSLAMECYLVDGVSSVGSFGLIALLLGWMNFDIIGLIWFANPLFLYSLFLFLFSKNSKLALILSLISSILALSFTQVEKIIKNEGGFTGQITEYLSGYWLWTTAIILLSMTLILNRILENNKNYA
ncbi:hypothetical protein SAMN05216480_10472 [Pustulibacterium marinum]|uniref:Uncharacterized protein n=1 Tax=Pustulibacterium marinum TaxID=1224947 RepID=A0A1I7GBN4_9FLAO|nr:hypothetical protein [Pustulibacterium marinum]SFU45850.1 hypothetical protein SAMN05216480_10472 [Pustulibacterium marinum]